MYLSGYPANLVSPQRLVRKPNLSFPTTAIMGEHEEYSIKKTSLTCAFLSPNTTHRLFVATLVAFSIGPSLYKKWCPTVSSRSWFHHTMHDWIDVLTVPFIFQRPRVLLAPKRIIYRPRLSSRHYSNSFAFHCVLWTSKLPCMYVCCISFFPRTHQSINHTYSDPELEYRSAHSMVLVCVT